MPHDGGRLKRVLPIRPYAKERKMGDAMRRMGLGLWLCLGVMGCGDDDGVNADGGRHASDAGDASSKWPEHTNQDAAGRPDADGAADACAPLTAPSDVLGAYGMAWNTPDVKARDCLLAQALITDAIYVDPMINARDRDALSMAIGSFRATSPKGSIDTKGDPMLRTSDLRFSWDFKNNGTTVISGIDYIQLEPSGQIAAVHGFWEPFSDGAAVDSVTAYLKAWNAADDTARDAALADAVSDAVRFIDATQDLQGKTMLADGMRKARTGGLARVTSVKLQSYGTPFTHARVQLTLEDGASKSTVTDYLRFDADGRIEHIGRFAEP
jgi:hypothetical protein